MRWRGAMLGALVLGLVATGAGSAAPADETAIGETFVTARAALQVRDAATALTTLSKADRARVDKIRKAALAGTKPALAELSPSERFAALGLRHYMTPAEIRKRGAAELIDYALAKGWLGPSAVRGAGLGKIKVDGDRATGTLLVDGKPQLFPASFVKEGGQWRIDLGRTLEITDAMIRTSAAVARQSEDKIIVEMLERASGRPVASAAR